MSRLSKAVRIAAQEATKLKEKSKKLDQKNKKKLMKDIAAGKAKPMPRRKPTSTNKKLGRLTEGTKKRRRDARIKRTDRVTPLGLREPKDEIPLRFKLGGIVTSVAKAVKKKSSLRDDYKPKIKNEKEIYSSSLKFPKQDYSDVIKNYEKTQKRIQRNRKVAGTAGGATAATVVASNVKDKK